MSEPVVFAAAMSHTPYITAFPERAAADARERFYGAMEAAGKALRAAAPDVVVILTSDHFTNLFVDRMPAFCVGVADSYEGPVEDWINLPPGTVQGDAQFGRAIVDAAFSSGMDPAFAHEIRLEHGVSVPLSFLLPGGDVPIVPVLINCMVPPLPSLRRCFAFGETVRAAASAAGRRVAAIGTGGLSHAPGAPEAGYIDEEFDRMFLQRLESDTPEAILDIPNQRIDSAGFGTWEIRQWAAALGASSSRVAQVLAYEPIAPWETGCAVAVFND